MRQALASQRRPRQIEGRSRVNELFFFYTMTLIIVCIVAAVISISAYASSRRRLFLFSCGLFATYGIEMLEIFFFEYMWQNMVFPRENFYDVNNPTLRTVIATISLALTWFIALDVLDRHNKKLQLLPVGVFFVAEMVVLHLISNDQIAQFVYYTLRQVFLFWIIGYSAYTYIRTKDAASKARLKHLVPGMIVTFCITVCIIIEDVFLILLLEPKSLEGWEMLYLSERNFSENVLVCAFAVCVTWYAYHVMSIRVKKAPKAEDVPDLERHAHDRIADYRQRHGLSTREAEILELVVQSKTNREIAESMFLALGTVKTHVHNILTKTGMKNREELIADFWRS